MLHFSGMMSVMMLMFFLVFAAIFGFIIYAFTHASKQNQQNRNAPRLTANAKVIAKRTDVRTHAKVGDFRLNVMDGGMSHTFYFAAFEFESGDRIELELPGELFGLLTEGDTGLLTYQGTVCLGFSRFR